MWVTILAYWFDLPLPMRLKANFRFAITNMKNNGMPDSAKVVFTGHSMGGGVGQDVAAELHESGEIDYQVLQAAYLTRKWFPPAVPEFSFPIPTLTIGAELNFGSARLPRMAEAMYKQKAMKKDFPVVMIEGMNHMQFATNLNKEDLKPEIDEETAQT